MCDTVPVILSGSSKARLLPISREAYLEQFLPLAGSGPMFQGTWVALELIEVQSSSYLGKGDIICFEEVCGRG